MLSLNASGGTLPGGVMIRESPSKASLGRTSVRNAVSGSYMISSFFDVFTEISLNGGQTWSPSISAPGTLSLSSNGIPAISAIHLMNPTRLGNSSFQFSFTNAPAAPFTVLATTNVSLALSNWTVLGVPVEVPAGQYQSHRSSGDEQLPAILPGAVAVTGRFCVALS